MKLELKTVGDAIRLQSACTELASRLFSIEDNAGDNLTETEKDALMCARELLDFFGDELLMNLKVFD